MIAAIKKAARFAWEYLIPHFETEEVALTYIGDDFTVDQSEWSAYEIICPLKCVEPGEEFMAIAEANSVTWLGIGITYRIGNYRPWPTEACRG